MLRQESLLTKQLWANRSSNAGTPSVIFLRIHGALRKFFWCKCGFATCRHTFVIMRWGGFWCAGWMPRRLSWALPMEASVSQLSKILHKVLPARPRKPKQSPWRNQAKFITNAIWNEKIESRMLADCLLRFSPAEKLASNLLANFSLAELGRWIIFSFQIAFVMNFA